MRSKLFTHHKMETCKSKAQCHLVGSKEDIRNRSQNTHWPASSSQPCCLAPLQSSWVDSEVSRSGPHSQSHDMVTGLPSQCGRLGLPHSSPAPAGLYRPWSPWPLDFANPPPQLNSGTTLLCSCSQITKWCWREGILADLINSSH